MLSLSSESGSGPCQTGGFHYGLVDSIPCQTGGFHYGLVVSIPGSHPVSQLGLSPTPESLAMLSWVLEASVMVHNCQTMSNYLI